MSTTSHEPSKGGESLAIEPCKPMMIDQFMPAFDVGKSRHRIVDAAAEDTWAALRSMDFSNVPSPLIRLGLAIHRQARKRAMAARGAKQTNVPRRLTFENLEDYGRIKLAEQPGFEIVVGAIAELGRRRIPETISVDDFVTLERPGYVKGVGSFSVRPYGAGRSLVS